VIAAPTAICTIDGAEGRLIYRGYSIEDLTEHTTFEEVVYLLWEGDLPTRAQLEPFKERLCAGRELPSVVIEHLRTIPPKAHPLAVLRTGVSLIAHFDPDADSMEQDVGFAGGAPDRASAVAACAWGRIRDGNESPVAPRSDLSEGVAGFLWMLSAKSRTS
jgi:citrate synthase